MAFCTKCGAQMSDAMNFCPECGHPVDKTARAEQANKQEEKKIQKEQFDNFVENVKEKLKDINNTKDTTSDYDQADIESNKFMAFLSYLSIFALIPFLTAKDTSPFVKFHVNQGAILLIAEILLIFMSFVIGPILLLSRIIFILLDICVFALAILGIKNVFDGKAKELPFLGSITIIQ